MGDDHKLELKQESFRSSNLKQEDSTFSYETESLPLKQTADYQAIVNSLNVLTALRTQALRDIDKVLQIQDEALANPMDFLSKLERGESLGIPDRLIVPKVPEPDWNSYHVPPGAFRSTRPKIKNEDSSQSQPQSCSDEEVVRGRKKSSKESKTYNQLWTAEEQIRLEELLVKFPPEPSESQRFRKIAEALGNRTLKQVTSRCQKYFLKLHNVGLPVPGRTPRRQGERKRKITKAKRGYRATSTFFPHTLPPVTWKDEGDLPGTSSVGFRIKEEPVGMDDSSDGGDEDAARAILHRRVRADLERQTDLIPASGFSCLSCKESPLRGTRWHCMECPEDIDICGRCMLAQLSNEQEETHPMNHQFASYRTVRTMTSGADREYSQPGEFNYLDPSFRTVD